MQILPCKIEGLKLVKPQVFGDDRGFFYESFHQKKYEALGSKYDFVQDNISKSAKGVLRGLHFQNPHPQGKFVSVLQGEIFDVAVDLRKNSSTFGKWEGFTLNGTNLLQLFIPPGFAHGFVSLSDATIISYKCSDFYNPQSEYSLLWSDPDLKIEWPIENPIISAKDSKGLRLKDIPNNALFD